MPNTYEDKTGKVFNTREEAKASNLALGTNPMPANINTGATPLTQNQTFMDWMKTPGNLTIPTSSLKEQVTPATVPPPPPPPDNTGLNSFTSSIFSGIDTSKDEETKKTAEGLLTKTILDYTEGEKALTTQTEEEKTASLALNKANSDLTALDQEYRTQVDNIRKTTTGMTRDQQQGALSEAQYLYEQRKANLTLPYLKAKGGFEAITRAIERKTDALDRKWQRGIDMYEALSKSIELTDKEQVIVQNNLQEMKAKKDLVRDAYASVLPNLQLNNAPQDVLDAVELESKNPNATAGSILKAAGRYGVDAKARLDIQKAQADLLKTQTEINALNNTFDFSSLGANDLAEQTIASSAKYGDQRMTDSQLLKIQQATNSLGSIQNLQGLLAQGSDGINLTGPVTGRVRNLLTKLGGDADASAINATIQGLIPTVARGIFGEVGVLTNADIDNYKKTIPNLTSSEQQNKLVTLIMYDVLARSLQNTLVTNAQNQTNVSGFLPTYRNAITQIAKSKAELGVTSLTGLENDELLDTVPSTASSTNKYSFTTPSFDSSNFWGNFNLK